MTEHRSRLRNPALSFSSKLAPFVRDVTETLGRYVLAIALSAFGMLFGFERLLTILVCPGAYTAFHASKSNGSLLKKSQMVEGLRLRWAVRLARVFNLPRAEFGGMRASITAMHVAGSPLPVGPNINGGTHLGWGQWRRT